MKTEGHITALYHKRGGVIVTSAGNASSSEKSYWLNSIS